MKIFLVFALVLLCGLAHGKSVADSSSKDENNNLEDQNCPNGCDDYQTITGTSKIKFGITIITSYFGLTWLSNGKQLHNA